jgi:predicted TIM-barrel fold metal-dependent hydrolase
MTSFDVGVVPRTSGRGLSLFGNIYMVCEEDEDLPETMKIIGADRIVLGSDTPHSESHPNSFQKFQKRTDLNDKAKGQILGENARRFLAR